MADNKFHDRLDLCLRCTRNPFDLCPVGSRLLQQQAADIGAQDETDAEFLDGDPAEP